MNIKIKSQALAKYLLKKSLDKRAFTLAEVLITLGIIGVIVAMTIPVLVQNIQDIGFQTKMKKEYSVLSEAFQLIKNENGGSFTDALATCSNPSICISDVFKQKLSYLKSCDTNDGTNLNVCFPALSKIKFLNGTAANDMYIGNSYTEGLVLKDGTSLAMELGNPSCTDTTGIYNNNCGWITVDVNGINPPNTWGRDIYVFQVYSDALRPCTPVQSAPVWLNYDDCTRSGTGWTCTSKYLNGRTADN